MKNPFLLFFLICSAALLQFSCSSTLQVQTVMPAKVSVAPDQWKVMAINRFNTDLLSMQDEEKEKIYKEGAQEAFLGAVDAILEDSTYYLAYIDTIYHLTEKLATPLSGEEVKNIYQQYPFHLLLSLDHFDLSLEQQTMMIGNEYGMGISMPYFTLVATSSWTLYDSLGNRLDKVSLSLDEVYQSGLSVALDRVVEDVNDLAWYTGYEYWRRLSPEEVTYERPYFYRGKMEAPAQRMKLHDWEGAIELLKPMAEGDKSESGKAAYNLAVAYEALGKLDDANYWATVALRKNIALAYTLLAELGQY